MALGTIIGLPSALPSALLLNRARAELLGDSRQPTTLRAIIGGKRNEAVMWRDGNGEQHHAEHYYELNPNRDGLIARITDDMIGARTGSSPNQITDTTKDWPNGSLVGGTIEITSGAALGERQTISANNSTVITIDTNWTVEPSGTDAFRIEAPAKIPMIDPAGSTTMPPVRLEWDLVYEDPAAYLNLNKFLPDVLPNGIVATRTTPFEWDIFAPDAGTPIVEAAPSIGDIAASVTAATDAAAAAAASAALIDEDSLLTRDVVSYMAGNITWSTEPTRVDGIITVGNFVWPDTSAGTYTASALDATWGVYLTRVFTHADQSKTLTVTIVLTSAGFVESQTIVVT